MTKSQARPHEQVIRLLDRQPSQNPNGPAWVDSTHSPETPARESDVHSNRDPWYDRLRLAAVFPNDSDELDPPHSKA